MPPSADKRAGRRALYEAGKQAAAREVDRRIHGYRFAIEELERKLGEVAEKDPRIAELERRVGRLRDGVASLGTGSITRQREADAILAADLRPAEEKDG
jgi:hypothetical protein